MPKASTNLQMATDPDKRRHVASILREMGLDPASDESRRAIGLVRDCVTWQGCGSQKAVDNPFFAGEVEPCINGQVGDSPEVADFGGT